ncbi:MAG TPA: terminase large subunit, partial [Solirubrobacteraceae bacterium]|nr:terminase large subunit [Solirubrobacteraceae bacterium]
MPSELEAFRRFCAALTLDNGRPMVLEPFQERLLVDYFAGARESVVIVPKKNGKTTTLGALALFHLLTVPEAECVIAASSRDQAQILFDQAAGFCKRSEGLRARVTVRRGYREIRAKDGGRIRVLAADADTADGVLPTLALVDELHRHKSVELYSVFRDGLGPRDGQMLTISTAGEDDESPLGVLRNRAYALAEQERDGAYHYARSDDGSFVLHEWCLEPTDDRDDLALVKAANPASWHTIESLRERRDSPSTTDWTWARFACGVWVRGGVQAWLSPEAWAACEDRRPIPPGAAVVIGFDGSYRYDATAIVAVEVGETPHIAVVNLWERSERDPEDWTVPIGR